MCVSVPSMNAVMVYMWEMRVGNVRTWTLLELDESLYMHSKQHPVETSVCEKHAPTPRHEQMATYTTDEL